MEISKTEHLVVQIFQSTLKEKDPSKKGRPGQTHLSRSGWASNLISSLSQLYAKQVQSSFTVKVCSL